MEFGAGPVGKGEPLMGASRPLLRSIAKAEMLLPT
jgi:hypothetical protein